MLRFIQQQRLVRVEGKLNGAKYKHTPNKNLFDSMQDLRIGQNYTFQHDNDPKQTAKTTQDWLKDKSGCSRVAQPEP